MLFDYAFFRVFAGAKLFKIKPTSKLKTESLNLNNLMLQPSCNVALDRCSRTNLRNS
jgi:hypothetical protein